MAKSNKYIAYIPDEDKYIEIGSSLAGAYHPDKYEYGRDKEIAFDGKKIVILDDQKRAAEAMKQAEARKDAEVKKSTSQQYLDEWQKNLEGVRGTYSQAMDYIKDPNFAGFGDLQDDVRSNLEEFKQTFGGIGQEAGGLAREQLGLQRELTSQYGELARPDYEGVSGKAMQDVASQAHLGRQAEARRLQSLGIDPTSGKFRRMMQKSRMGEALAKAQAGTQARMMEKQRAAGMATTGLQVIDPAKTAGLGLGISRQEQDYQQMLGGIKTAETGARATAAGALGGVGQQLYETGKPQEEMAGLHAGLGRGEGSISVPFAQSNPFQSHTLKTLQTTPEENPIPQNIGVQGLKG